MSATGPAAATATAASMCWTQVGQSCSEVLRKAGVDCTSSLSSSLRPARQRLRSMLSPFVSQHHAVPVCFTALRVKVPGHSLATLDAISCTLFLPCIVFHLRLHPAPCCRR